MLHNLFLLLCIASVAWGETFVSTDVPVNIPDEGTAESFMTIPVNRRIEDVNITLTITHTFDGDLGLYLEAPNGDDVQLAFRLGNSGNNYTNTTFDDEASIPIQNGAPPFTGSFRPSHQLSELDGLGTLGTWTFRVTDNGANDIGTIDAWQLTMVLSDTLAATNPQPEVVASPGLLAAYPNPFNPVTTLVITLSQTSPVRLAVYNIVGQEIALLANQTYSPGAFHIVFDGSAEPAGLYLARLDAGAFSTTRKLLLVK